jgi:4-amino-4-deoxy-L-arabinose transferase-like glycosyltransferase
MLPSAVFRRLAVLAVVALWAGGVWMRTTSLTTAPDPNADEAFYGVQAVKLLRGQAISAQTGSNKPINPFLLGLEVPLVALFGPTMDVLRGAAAFWGLLAVILMYALMARVLDRPTALVAATLLLVLPLAIVHSRIAAEPGHIPVWGVVTLASAFAGSPTGVLLGFLGGLLAHPTTVMTAPVALLVLMVRLAQKHWGDPARRWRAPLIAAIGGAAVIGPVVLWNRNSAAAQWTYATYGFEHHDWGLFASRLQKAFLGFCNGVPSDTTTGLAVLFWGVVGSVLTLGGLVLARRRRWDRLALVAGVVLTGAGYHLALGPGGFHPALTRYGLFLVAPAVLAFACAATALLVEARTPRLARVRSAQVAGLLAAAFALLACYKIHHFDVFAGQWAAVHETARTFRTEAIDPKRHIARLIARDLRNNGNQSPTTVIVTEDWWHYRPIQLYYAWRDDVRVADLEHTDPACHAALIRRQLEAGGYAVGDERTDALVRSLYPPGALRTWRVKLGAHPASFVHRLKRPGEAIARLEGAGTRR